MVLLSLLLRPLGAIACLAIAFIYMYFHRGWFRNDFGKLVVLPCLTEGLLLSWVSVAAMLPKNATRDLISLILFGVVTSVMVYRAVAYGILERRLLKEKRNAAVVEESKSDS